jgi:bacillaene synthase trans-acting acyltransferase
MFSGQGSQYFQMGHALFVQNPVFRSWMLRQDEVVRELSGHSIVEVLYSLSNRKCDPFTRTLFTHPAIFMVEYSLAQALIGSGVVPDMTLGASLGSLAAAAISGCVSVEDALSAVVRQASAFESSCAPGGMIAIVADPALFLEGFLCEFSELAGVNFSSHFVVSCPQRHLKEIERALEARRIVHQRLPVSFAFHSRWIDAAQGAVETLMRSLVYRTARLPMMCCEKVELLFAVPEDYFWGIARNAIRFRDAVLELEQGGCYRYIDVGPAGTLANLLKHGLSPTSRSTTYSVLTPYGRDVEKLELLSASRRQ